MLAYYFLLALRSLRRNVGLTVLMIAAIGVGIGASTTMLTIFRAMNADPIPTKSAQLYAPQIDALGPGSTDGASTAIGGLPSLLTYTDAVALMNFRGAKRQTPTYATTLAITPSNSQLHPFEVGARATYSDLFPMFEVPFQYGGPWSAADDTGHALVVVLTRELNENLFAGTNSVGRSVRLNNNTYRVAGVLDRWRPVPRFYDLFGNHRFGKSEEVFLPFTTAIDGHMQTSGAFSCGKGETLESGWEGALRSGCVWLQFWAELPSVDDASRYRSFIGDYAAEQHRSGRLAWQPQTGLSDVREWLVNAHVVSDEVRILVLVSFGFLLVCLLNAVGLMLAKVMGRARDISVRRALGANRRSIFTQCMIEAGVVGLAGGLLGLLLAGLGLLGLRALFSEQIAALSRLDLTDVSLAVLLALTATLTAGLYPTWRAAKVQPAWQLKAQ